MPQATIIGVIPQYPNHSKQNVFGKERVFPLGIVFVMSQIEGYDTYIIDENNYKGAVDSEDLPDHSELQRKNPAKIAMFYGGMSISIPRLYSVAKQYKEQGIITVAGGKHMENLPREALNSGVDIVVHGEGEKVIQNIVNAIVKDGKIAVGYKRNLEQIPGISFLRDNGEYVLAGERAPMAVGELNALKDPNLELIKFINKKWTAIPVSWGIGCNFDCEFCTVKEKYRARAVEKLLKQIDSGINLGYHSFFIVDDNVTQNPDSAIEMFTALGDYTRKIGKKIGVTIQTRTKVAENDKLIKAMKYAGVNTICIGYESPIDEELKAMRKGVTVEKLVERSKKLSKYFYIHGMFIFGYPTFKDSKYRSGLTTKEKAKRYEKFFRNSGIDTIQVFNAVPLIGSELRERLDREGRLIPLSQVGWDKYDGAFLCYDPTPEGIDPSKLQDTPIKLMEKKYVGNALGKVLNHGRWVNWSINTIGFPVRFGTSYIRNFFGSLTGKRIIIEEKLLSLKNVFYVPLVRTWKVIKRDWRTTLCNTVGGVIIRKWKSIYRKSSYPKVLKRLHKQRRIITKPEESITD